MFKLNSHKALSEYILRKLGSPVINVELSPEQLDDCIYDAINYFIERHYDGIEEVLVVVGIDEFVRQDGYVELPDEIVGVANILNTSSESGSVEGFDNLNFLIANSEILKFSNDLSGIENYVRSIRTIADIKHFFTPFRDYEFNKVTNRLFLRSNLSSTNSLGVIGYRAIDPDTDTDVYNDEWIKRYATALARVQWGVNLTKYEGMDLPGQGTINGQGILAKGENDLEKTLEEFEMTYNHPPLPRIA